MNFQDYVTSQVFRALTFFVSATNADLLRFVLAAFSNGPGPYKNHYLYSVKSMSVIKQFTDLIDEVLENRTPPYSEEVGYWPILKQYYIQDIWNTEKHRRSISHLIFDAIAETSSGEGAECRATLPQIITYVTNNIDQEDLNDVLSGFNETNSSKPHGTATVRTILRLHSMGCVLKDDEFVYVNFS